MHSPKRAASPTPSPPSISPTKSAKSSIQLVRTLSNPILSFLNPWNSDEVLPSSSHPAGPNSPPVSGKYRRKSATLARLARLRLVQISLAASIPILGLLLLFELSVHRTRTGQWLEHSQALDGWRKGAGGLGGWREGLVKRHMEMSSVLRTKRTKRTTDTSGDADLLRKIREHADEAWPIWWGSSDHAKSPFDFVPPPLVGEKKRILFLTDYKDYLERMNTHTYEIVDAALRHPHVTVDVWGPGWAGYDRSVPLSENIRRRAWRIAQLEESKAEHSRRKEVWWEYEMGKYKRKMRGQRDGGDAGNGPGEASGHLEKPREWEKPGWVLKRVLTPGPAAAVTADEGGALAISRERSEEGNEGCHPTVQFDVVWTISDIYKQNDPHVDALGCNALLVQQVGDCHSSRCLKEWYPYANNITLSKYAFELQELFNYPDMKERFPGFEMGIFGHSPDTGNEWHFYPIPWKDRTRDAVSSGFDGSFYPIRSTVNSHINSLPSIASLLEQQEKDRLDAEAAEQKLVQEEAEAKARAETETEIKAEAEMEAGTVDPIAGSVVDHAPVPSVTKAADDSDTVPPPLPPSDTETTSDIDAKDQATTEATPSPESATVHDEDPVTSHNSETTTDTPSSKRKRDIPPDVQTKESFVIQRHAHPGYTISIPSEALDTPLETYENGHAYYTTHEKIREDFANGMRTSRICVFDSSVERKMIRKYAQALLSGCVVAADLPTEHEEHLGNFVIRLEQHWGIDEIEGQIKNHLAQPELLERMALEGFAYARSHLTTTKKISDVLAMAAAHRSGERGYLYEHNFASRCRAYWASDEAYRPPWCSGIAGKESKLT